MAALVASALAGGLVAASLAGAYGLAAGVALAQVLLVIGMTRTVAVPAARLSAAVALVAGWAAVPAMALQDEQDAVEDRLLPVLVAVGAGFVAMVVVQLARRDGRSRLTASLTFGVSLLLLTTALAGWLAPGDDTVGTAVLLLGLTGAAVGAAIMIFPGPAPLWLVGGAVAAGSVGLLLQVYVDAVDDADLGPQSAAVIAASCGLASAIGVWAARLLRDDTAHLANDDTAHLANDDAAELASGDAHLDNNAAATTPPLDHVLTVATLPLALAAPAVVAGAWAVAEGLLG